MKEILQAGWIQRVTAIVERVQFLHAAASLQKLSSVLQPDDFNRG
jgi:hypothetical protein